MADVGGVVDALGLSVDRVEVLGERRPGPVDARRHGRPGDVLGPFEVPHDELPCLRRGRGEREAAMPHDRGGDAVPARVRPELVPEDLGVEVGVPVDESGRDHMTLGVDVHRAVLTDPADGGDAPPGDAHVGPVRGHARPVDDGAVADDDVVGHRSAPCRARSGGARSAGSRSSMAMALVRTSISSSPGPTRAPISATRSGVSGQVESWCG